MSTSSTTRADAVHDAFDDGRAGDAVERERALRALEARLFGRAEPDERAVARHRLVRRLGAGGGGVVYLAFDPELDRQVAIKLVRSDRTGSARREASARLLAEAQTLARLRHPNVVAVHDVGTCPARTLADSDAVADADADTADPDVYVVMEYLEGVTLAEWLARGRRELNAILEAFVAAGRGLVAAHDVGLVHRDFKPSNVIRTAAGRVVVLDFGLAKRVVDPDPSPGSASSAACEIDGPATASGVAVGTLAYMAPEQMSGGAVGPAADQFAWCVALWEAIHGERPFAGTDIATLRTAFAGGPRPGRASVPRWLDTALRRGLAVDSHARHPSMTALLDVLHHGSGRRRRWTLAVSGVAMAGALAGLGMLGGRTDSLAICSGADELANTWDEGVAQRLRSAFAQTGRSYAETTSAAVLGDLDRYAEALVAARARACADAVDGTRSPDEIARTMACLDGRRERLRSTVAVLLAADPEILDHATSPVAALPPIEECARVATSIPSDAPAAVELEQAIARAEVLTLAGKHVEALPAAEAATESARTLADPRLLTHALLTLGRARMLAEQARGAEAPLREALALAREIGDMDGEARAGTALIEVLTQLDARYDEAERLVDEVEVAIERGELDVLVRADLRAAVGEMYDRRLQHDAAVLAFTEALQLRERRLGPDHVWVAVTLQHLGSALVGARRYEDAAPHVARARAIWDRHGAEHPGSLPALALAAALSREHGRLEEALAITRQALRIAEKAHGPTHPNTASRVGDLAAALAGVGRIDEAIPVSERYVALREAALGPEHPELAIALLNHGEHLRSAGRTDEAVAGYRRAHTIFERHFGPDSPQVGQAASHIGLALHRDRRCLDARISLRRATELLERPDRPDDFALALASIALCECERRLGNVEAAITAIERAGTLLVRIEGEDGVDTQQARFMLAELIVDRDRERALRLARDARTKLQGRAEHVAVTTLADVEAWLRKHDVSFPPPG